jgi:hypothetical protein
MRSSGNAPRADARGLLAALIIGATGVVGCGRGEEPQKVVGRTVPPDRNSERQVIAWLARVPFRDADNHHRTEPDSGAPDYESWLRSGREIEGVETTLRRLLESRDPRTDPAQVCYALGWVGGKESLQELLPALRDDDPRVRTEAAASLGRLGDPGGVEPLCGTLARDVDSNVRANACVALGLIGDRRSAPYLRGAENDKSEFVAGLAREALTRLNKGL